MLCQGRPQAHNDSTMRRLNQASGGNGHRSDASLFCVELLAPWRRRKGASSAAWTAMCSRTRTGQDTDLESHLPMFHRGHSAGKALWLLVRHGAKKEGALQPRDVEYFLTARILGNYSSRLDALAKEASFWALCFSCNTKPLDYGTSATEGVFRNNQGFG